MKYDFCYLCEKNCKHSPARIILCDHGHGVCSCDEQSLDRSIYVKMKVKEKHDARMEIDNIIQGARLTPLEVIDEGLAYLRDADGKIKKEDILELMKSILV